MKGSKVLLISLFALLFVGSMLPVLVVNYRASIPRIQGHIKDLKLTDFRGTQFDSENMRGKLWLVQFFFTSCPMICPTVTADLKRIKNDSGLGSDLEIVSISVDPANDTDERLNQYIEKHQINSPDWWVIREELKQVQSLALEQFKIGISSDPAAHSARIVLIDRSLNLRGAYLANDSEALVRLARDIKSLS